MDDARVAAAQRVMREQVELVRVRARARVRVRVRVAYPNL